MAEDSLKGLWRNISNHFQLYVQTQTGEHGSFPSPGPSPSPSPGPSFRPSPGPSPRRGPRPSPKPSPNPSPSVTAEEAMRSIHTSTLSPTPRPGPRSSESAEGSLRNIQIEAPLDFMDVAKELRSHVSQRGEAGILSAVELVERAFRAWRWVRDQPSTISFFLAELWRGVFSLKPWEEPIAFTMSSLKQILRPSSSFNEVETLFCLSFMERYTNPFQPSARLNLLYNLLRATKESNHKGDDEYVPLRAIALMDMQFLLDQLNHNLQGIDKDMLLESYGMPPMPLKMSLGIWKQLSYILSANTTRLKDMSSANKGIFCQSMGLTCEHELVMFDLWRESGDLMPRFLATKERIALTTKLGLLEEELLACHDLACLMGLLMARMPGMNLTLTESLFKELVQRLSEKGYKRWVVDVLEDVQGIRDLGKPVYFSAASFADCYTRFVLATELAIANKACLRDQIRRIYSICDLGRVLWVLQNKQRSKDLLDEAVQLYMDIVDAFGSPLRSYPLEVTGLEWARCKEALGSLSSIHDIMWSQMFYSQAKEVYEELHMLTPDREASLLLCGANLCLGPPLSSEPDNSKMMKLEKLLDKVEEKLRAMTAEWLEGGGMLMVGRYKFIEYTSLDLKGHLHFNNGEFVKALECMEQFAVTTKTHLSSINVTKLCSHLGDEQAAARWRKVALTKFKEEQRAIGEVSLAWEQFYGEYEADEFVQIQINKIQEGNVDEALVWSEWSHDRFLSAVLMNRNGNDNGVVEPNHGDGMAHEVSFQKMPPFNHFDSNAHNAWKTILDGCSICSGESVLVEYHFQGRDFDNETLVIYVVNLRGQTCNALAIPYEKLLGVQVHVEELNDVIKSVASVPKPIPRSSPACHSRSCEDHNAGSNSERGLTWEQRHQLSTGISPARRRRMMNTILEKLYELLIGPIEQYIERLSPEDKLIIVPHDILWSVPFAMLRDGKRLASDKPYLIERHTVAVVPGIHLLPTLKKRSEDLSKTIVTVDQSNSNSWKSLVVGNPSPIDFSMENLLCSGMEAEKIYNLLTPGTATLLTGKDATKMQVVRALQCGAPIAHFATHLLVGSRDELKIDVDYDMGALILSHDYSRKSVVEAATEAGGNCGHPCSMMTNGNGTKSGLSSSAVKDANCDIDMMHPRHAETGELPVDKLCSSDQPPADVESAITAVEGPAIQCNSLEAEVTLKLSKVDLVDLAPRLGGVPVSDQRSSEKSDGDANAAGDGVAARDIHSGILQAEEARNLHVVEDPDAGPGSRQEVSGGQFLPDQHYVDNNADVLPIRGPDTCLEPLEALQAQEILQVSQTESAASSEDGTSEHPPEDNKVTRDVFCAASRTEDIGKPQVHVQEVDEDISRVPIAGHSSSCGRQAIDQVTVIEPEPGECLDALPGEEMPPSEVPSTEEIDQSGGPAGTSASQSEFSTHNVSADTTMQEVPAGQPGSWHDGVCQSADVQGQPTPRLGISGDNRNVDMPVVQVIHTGSAHVIAGTLEASVVQPGSSVKAKSGTTEMAAASIAQHSSLGLPPQSHAKWTTPPHANEFPGALPAEEVLEVFGNDVKSLLVVLSCCSSAKGLFRPEGVLSYARAFLISQVPSLVASLWPVSDKGTFALMLSFYKALSEGHDVSSSLRLAMLQMLSARQPSTSTIKPGHPNVIPVSEYVLDHVRETGLQHAQSEECDSENEREHGTGKECEREEEAEHAFGIPTKTLVKEMKALTRGIRWKPSCGGCGHCVKNSDHTQNDGTPAERGAKLSRFSICEACCGGLSEDGDEGEDDADEDVELMWQPDDWGAFLCIGLPTLTLPGGLFASAESAT